MPAIHLVNFLYTVQMPGPLPSDLKSLPFRVQDMYQQLTDFMSEYVYPSEAELSRHQASEDCWTPHPLVEEIKVEVSSFSDISYLGVKRHERCSKKGKWNRFIPRDNENKEVIVCNISLSICPHFYHVVRHS